MFKPIKRMRQAKARFHNKVGISPLEEPENMSIAKVAQLCGCNAYREWNSLEGFRDWFFNRESAKDLLMAASEEAVYKLWELVSAESGKLFTPTAQVNAAKTLLEYGGFAPPKTKSVVFSDDAINKMSEAELTKFIDKELKVVKE